jgi:hypothetical protein
MAWVIGGVAFDLVAIGLERVDQLGDLTGDLGVVRIKAELLVLMGELRMELDSGPPRQYGISTLWRQLHIPFRSTRPAPSGYETTRPAAALASRSSPRKAEKRR